MKYKARLLGRPELFVDGTPYIFTFKKAQILALMLVKYANICGPIKLSKRRGAISATR